MDAITAAALADAILIKLVVFALGGTSLYYAYRILSNVELQRLLLSEEIKAGVGKFSIAGGRILPGTAFILVAATMIAIGCFSNFESRVVARDGNGSLELTRIVRGLGPVPNAEKGARKREADVLDQVIGALATPTAQFSDADKQTLTASLNDLRGLRAHFAEDNSRLYGDREQH